MYFLPFPYLNSSSWNIIYFFRADNSLGRPRGWLGLQTDGRLQIWLCSCRCFWPKLFFFHGHQNSSLLESSFSHFRTTELSLISNLTLKQTAVHLFCLLREGRNFKQWISGKQLFQGNVFSQAVCRVNTNPSNTDCAKSLSPDQIITPLLEKIMTNYSRIANQWSRKKGHKKQN